MSTSIMGQKVLKVNAGLLLKKLLDQQLVVTRQKDKERHIPLFTMTIGQNSSRLKMVRAEKRVLNKELVEARLILLKALIMAILPRR